MIGVMALRIIVMCSMFGNVLYGEEEMEIKLCEVSLSTNSLDEAIYNRRSIRKYKNEKLSFDILSKFLWASYGKNALGKKTVPSAGATYPLEIYVVIGNVENIENGIYHYDGVRHLIKLIKKGDFRKELAIKSYKQMFIADASFIIVISADFKKTTSRYGDRGYRYVYMEAGHSGQNIHLVASSLRLGTVMIGAFDDKGVKDVLGIDEEVLYLCPVGKP